MLPSDDDACDDDYDDSGGDDSGRRRGRSRGDDADAIYLKKLQSLVQHELVNASFFLTAFTNFFF